MAKSFIGREAELGTLNRLWDTPGAELVLVWGPRRVGKSFLLNEFARGKRAVIYTATERAPELELADFSDRVRQVLTPGPRDVLASGPFRSWDEALRYLAGASERQRLLVVLDEFSYLVESDPSLASVIQRFWDNEARSSKLHLILCGSATSVLEGLGAERAPLFGRFSARVQIHPFSFKAAAEFNEKLSAVDLCRVYGVIGGMPLYLKMWNDTQSWRQNLVRLFGDPSSPLLNEGELVLRTELPEAAGYFRLMHAVAHGRTKYSEIRDVAGIEPARSLERLTAVRLMERRVPVTQDPDRTRVRIYRITDNFLSFWFRFVYPNRGEIERGLGPAIVDQVMAGTAFENHMGPVFEEMTREYVRMSAGTRGVPAVTRVGAWWTADGRTEIDVVAIDGKVVALAGEAKWSRHAGRRELDALRLKVEVLPAREGQPLLALFAREDFRGIEEREALLVSAEDLYQ